ncbi:MAG: S-formylglutathione hydrolase [Oligoflexales bacterium]
MISLRKKYKSFGGWTEFYEHHSQSTGTIMRFSVYRPSASGPLPVLYWLSGLTCTDENFMQKAGAQRMLAELGVILVAPDTSPRACDLPGEDETYSFGTGAGFYVDAIQQPWNSAYKMYSYVSDELPQVIEENFPVDSARKSIFGHSMGGHGAMVIGLRNPKKFRSISAFAPICAPSQCPWGDYAFSRYLGDEKESWYQYDTCKLIEAGCEKKPILIDQGLEDEFLKSEQLHTSKLEEVCKKKDYGIELRMHSAYDHSYYFIASFLEDHLRFHQRYLES